MEIEEKMEPLSLTPEGIEKLQQLKAELESMTRTMSNMEGKSQYEVEGRIRAFQEKENEIKQFLQQLGMMPDG